MSNKVFFNNIFSIRQPLALLAWSLLGFGSGVAHGERPEQSAEGLPACFETVQSDVATSISQDRFALQAENLDEALADGAKVFYLNRNGGTFSAGADDSRRNRSSLTVTDSIIPAWNVDDENWTDIVECVRGLFAPYNAWVTDVDPIGPSHVEAVVGGSYLDLNNQIQRPVGGVAPFPSDCGVIDNSVVYIFAEDALGDNRRVCEIIAHEIAHSYGLDHSYYCEDVMSYLDGCGDKTFVNGSVPCGENVARECKDTLTVPPTYDCQKEVQNPALVLSERLGRAPSPEARGGCSSINQSSLLGLWIFLLAFFGVLRHPFSRCRTQKS